jgi:nucleoside-diphosphate-sugar epimerase
MRSAKIADTVRIAVTGANGFLGKNVIRALSENASTDLIAIVRSVTTENTLPTKITYFEHDLSWPTTDVYERLGKPDVLVHLAWGGLPNYRSLHHIELELPLSYGFIKYMVQAGLSHVLVTGTCYEYGMRNGAMGEEDIPQPANAYALAKDMLRQQLQCLQSFHPFDLTWARLFYMFGEGQSASSLYSQLMSVGKSGADRFPMSPGDQVRDYLPVSEVAEKLATLVLHHKNIGNINICSGQPTTVKQQVEKLMTTHNFDMTLDLGVYPYPDHEPMAFWGDTAKWQRVIGNIAADTPNVG